MSKKEKLILRLQSLPKDFTYDEMVSLLAYMGYQEFSSGRTSGSAVRFMNPNSSNMIKFHKPHPESTLKKYVLEQVIEVLEREGLI